MRIIIADDEATNRLVLVVMLRRLGHSVRAVVNGAELLRELQRERADLLLIDVHMPILDGIDAAKVIVQTMGDVGRPILIAMTANDDHRIRQVCMSAGMDDLLLKPFNQTGLRQVLSRWSSRVSDPRSEAVAAPA